MLQHVYNRLLVQDFPACFRFYRDTLGFTPVFGDENDVYTEFETGGATLALFRRDLMAEAVGTTSKPAHADAQDKAAFIYRVENVDHVYTELQSRGVTFITAPEDRPDWGIRTAHFRDPDGSLIEIFHGLPTSA